MALRRGLREQRAAVDRAGKACCVRCCLQVLYTVRSERLLMEQLDYNFLFRWFVGLNIDDPVWDVTVFTKNRERLLVADVAQGFFNAVLDQARCPRPALERAFYGRRHADRGLGRTQEFQAQRRTDQQTPPDDPGNPSVDFHGERRTNATHQSTTDPEARLARKGSGKEAKLCYAGHVQMDNRHGLVVNTRADSGQRQRRTRGGPRDGGRDRGPASSHAGRR